MIEHTSMETADSAWNAEQRAYWSSLTRQYDGFYKSRWSALENSWVEERLRFLCAIDAPKILDLGCGTGLGARLASTWAPLTAYVGVDISPQMAEHTARGFGVRTRVGAMDELGWVSDNSVDAVICLFSSASFVKSPERLFREVCRVLNPGGRAYISALGRAWGGSPKQVRFGTRGNRAAITVPAWRFDPANLHALIESSGLRVNALEKMNALSGICELPILWKIGTSLARALPRTAHLLEASCSKPFPELT